MKKLIEFSEDKVFYKGTIIIIKDAHISPKGNFDKKYCMIAGFGSMGTFQMLDLYRSMGSFIIHDLAPNVKGHFGCNKQGIKEWVRQYFESFYDTEWHQHWFDKLDEIIYIEYLNDYFTQANRDLFIQKD